MNAVGCNVVDISAVMQDVHKAVNGQGDGGGEGSLGPLAAEEKKLLASKFIQELIRHPGKHISTIRFLLCDSKWSIVDAKCVDAVQQVMCMTVQGLACAPEVYMVRDEVRQV